MRVNPLACYNSRRCSACSGVKAVGGLPLLLNLLGRPVCHVLTRVNRERLRYLYVCKILARRKRHLGTLHWCVVDSRRLSVTLLNNQKYERRAGSCNKSQTHSIWVPSVCEARAERIDDDFVGPMFSNIERRKNFRRSPGYANLP